MSVSSHSVCEEVVFYPLLEKHLPSGKEVADHSRKEHLQVKEDLVKLDKMNVTDEGYNELVEKTMKELQSHIKEEETSIFPKFKEAVAANVLNEAGEKFVSTRKMAPTHPHPGAPDKPPAETAAGMTALPLDKARDLTRDFVDTGRES
ncbi:12779_t:CDS:2 [Acaulospora colombiana]|uniref:12779_t:CDS:1 n=1 Tax=Acaulospora colombiana TaxID=27376 RepID=A0ACA9M799_9GLOM|nr:12779_t:CDS:2 [Acaulospora colombiana]